jgi:hypothetical protein
MRPHSASRHAYPPRPPIGTAHAPLPKSLLAKAGAGPVGCATLRHSAPDAGHSRNV